MLVYQRVLEMKWHSKSLLFYPVLLGKTPMDCGLADYHIPQIHMTKYPQSKSPKKYEQIQYTTQNFENNESWGPSLGSLGVVYELIPFQKPNIRQFPWRKLKPDPPNLQSLTRCRCLLRGGLNQEPFEKLFWEKTWQIETGDCVDNHGHATGLVISYWLYIHALPLKIHTWVVWHTAF